MKELTDPAKIKAAMRVREQNLKWIELNKIKFVETNVIYAVAIKS